MATSKIPTLPDAVKAKRSVAGWQLFAEAVRTAMSRWDLLRTAVVEEWGGRGSKAKFEHILADLMLNCEEQWRAGHDLHEDTLDVYLLECCESDFNIDFEDDTAVTALSLVIQDLYRKCAAGDLDAARAVLTSLDARPDFNPDPHAVARARAGEDDDSEGSGSDDEDGEEGGAGAGAGASGPGRRAHQVDDDGWETIPVRGGRGAGASSGAGAGGGSAAGGDASKGAGQGMDES